MSRRRADSDLARPDRLADGWADALPETPECGPAQSGAAPDAPCQTIDIDAGRAAPRAALPRARIEVFAASPSVLATVQGAAQDRCAAFCEFLIHRGGFPEALARYREHSPPDLILVEDTAPVGTLELQIKAMAELCPPGTRLVIIGLCNDIAIYRRLMKLGVSDYMAQPVTLLTLLDSLGTILLEQDSAREPGLVVAFVGARGGAGASMVAHNAAALFRRAFDATTLLIDADLGFGTAALQFDIAPAHDLGDALSERTELDSAALERLTHWTDKRFGILAAPERLDQLVAPEPNAMLHLIDQARRLASFIVLDLPLGWAPQTIEAIMAADRVVLVATPDLPSLRNARTLLALTQRLRPNDAPAHVILNRMPTQGKPAVPKEAFARILDRPITAVLPCDAAVVSAETSGQVLCEATPESEVVRGIETLIAAVSGRALPGRTRQAPGSVLSRLFGWGR